MGKRKRGNKNIVTEADARIANRKNKHKRHNNDKLFTQGLNLLRRTLTEYLSKRFSITITSLTDDKRLFAKIQSVWPSLKGNGLRKNDMLILAAINAGISPNTPAVKYFLHTCCRHNPQLAAAVSRSGHEVPAVSHDLTNIIPLHSSSLQDLRLKTSTVKRKDSDHESFIPTFQQTQAFYRSVRWRESEARYAAWQFAGNRCLSCGATSHEAKLEVDHIKPVKYFWSLRFDKNNVQLLCNRCNRTKGSWDMTDWRNR
jgi:5-methylcytosine-specific restriction endonuclease McrA